MKTLMRFLKDEEGVTAVEYGLIAALIALAILGTVTALGGGLNATFQTISAAFPIGGGS